MSLLDEITERLGVMTPEDKSALVQQMAPVVEKMRFVPLPGAQTEAYLSEADILLYGGSAGCGKSFLSMGLASQEHQHAIVFRRDSTQTDGLERSGKDIIGDSARYNGTSKEWTWPDGRSLKLAGLQYPDDWIKHAGRERDLLSFDEAGEFLREQVASLIAWNRGPPGQRCRILLASNPPRSADGYWLKEWFAPWLDPNFPNRASPGELRWAVMIDGSPMWVDGPDDPATVVNGEQRQVLSFTFIPAKLSDNPYRDTADYRAKIDSLPEPLRSQLKYGDFSAGVEDDLNQAIPTDWVKQARARWSEARPAGIPQCSIGVDVAQGGTDKTVLAIRYDGWFAPLQSVPGSQTPGGSDVAGLVLSKRHDNSVVVVDLGGGWGGDALAHLVRNGVDAQGYMGVKESSKRTRDQQLRFANIRTEAYWRLREALDPSQDGGSYIAFPNDDELMADLTAVRFEVKPGKGGMVIHLETKKDLVKRIGRSPDRGDAVVMAWYAGAKHATDGMLVKRERRMTRTPQVIMRKRG